MNEKSKTKAGLKSKTIRFESTIIVKALEKTEGNVARAALLLQIPRPTLMHKMKRYGIDAELLTIVKLKNAG